MRFHNITYLLKEGGRNIFSNKLMSFACIGVLVACFLLIGSAVLVSITINNLVTYVESQNEVVAILEEDTTEDDIDIIGLTLQNMDNVGRVTFQPKEEALELKKIQAAEYGGIFEGLEDDNPLPDSYVIQVRELDVLDDTVREIRAVSGVEKVIAHTEVASILSSVKDTVNYAGSGVVLILIVVSIVIITNTIKLTVFSRRKEINIMKYVGATDSFIRMPFLVEGMLIGLLAAIFAFVILGVGYTYLVRWAGENYSGQLGILFNSAVNFIDIAWFIFALFAAIGIFIGTIGSGAFVRKYLKV